ncbi:hypothetical protein G7Y89_g4684 [Cudoniella acicularis]|uniref:Uncharacterized protein n=1 Tax=Cudoniella acicularis TaxID=354080 RepID=A0A8H4W4G7_9HELO|nr:hypothetical protein G7Y89_g4684 [Cudoniella acicularis]
MRKTPKAPSDIDNWVIDPPTSNNSVPSIARNEGYGMMLRREAEGINGTSQPISSISGTLYTDKAFVRCAVILSILFILVAVLIASSGTARRFIIKCLDGMGRKSRFIRDPIERKTTMVFVVLLLGSIVTCLYIIGIYYYKEAAPWSAAASFLNTCKEEKEIGNPIGEECEKYLGKELKPKPTLSRRLKFAMEIAISLIVLVVLIGALLVLRRLNKVNMAIKVASDVHSYSRTSSIRARSRPRPAENPDIDSMSVDPLMMTGSEIASARPGSYQSAPQSSAHEISASPPSFKRVLVTRPLSSSWVHSPPHTHYPLGYKPVATSDLSSSNSSASYRNPALESTPPVAQTDRGYFDIPVRLYRNSRSSFARRPSQHGRNWSTASDESGVALSAASSRPAELDADPEEERKSSLRGALQQLGMGRIVSRRRSTSPRLGHIPEAGESCHQVDTAGMSLTDTQLKDPEAGLSNSQLREMTMFEANPYIRDENR